MFKIGQKAAHFMSQNKVGIIIDIKYEKSKLFMLGGTSAKDIFVFLKYDDETIQKIKSSDLIRIYD